MTLLSPVPIRLARTKSEPSGGFCGHHRVSAGRRVPRVYRADGRGFEPGVARTGARPTGRRTCCSSCSTTSGTGSSRVRRPRRDAQHRPCGARSGLRYANMHTTALCSPTRSCVLTGRNHHSNGVACIMELATGYPGYDGRMPFENGMLPEMLLDQGYNTFCLGKWHLSPSEENTPAGPFHRWPLGRGFERFYGFLGGETNQWYPDLTQDNSSVTQPRTPEEGYHLSEDLADHAIKLILDAHVNAPEKPFFMYYAPGAAHAPHHVPKEWADRYRGKFDAGWDAYRETVFATSSSWASSLRRPAVTTRPRRAGVGLAVGGRAAPLHPHDGGVRRLRLARRPPLRPHPGHARGARRARQHLDHGHLRQRRLGRGRRLRILQRDAVLQQRARESSTRTSRRSTSWAARPPTTTTPGAGPGPGTPRSGVGSGRPTGAGRPTRSSSPGRPGWRRGERSGRSTPTPSTWSRRCSTRWASSRRRRSAASTQTPLEGVSFAHTFDDPDAADEPHTQYFEMFGHRSIYHDGWRAVCPWPAANFTEAASSAARWAIRSRRNPRAVGSRGLGALRNRRGPDRVT